jgi:hypothetical protein
VQPRRKPTITQLNTRFRVASRLRKSGAMLYAPGCLRDAHRDKSIFAASPSSGQKMKVAGFSKRVVPIRLYGVTCKNILIFRVVIVFDGKESVTERMILCQMSSLRTGGLSRTKSAIIGICSDSRLFYETR